jgi:hypothetical protein
MVASHTRQEGAWHEPTSYPARLGPWEDSDVGLGDRVEAGPATAAWATAWRPGPRRRGGRAYAPSNTSLMSPMLFPSGSLVKHIQSWIDPSRCTTCGRSENSTPRADSAATASWMLRTRK